MGATQFRTYGRGMSAKKAYDTACEYALEEYGHQEGYNGTISTTDGFRDLTEEFKRSKLSLEQFIDKQCDAMSKRQCACICIEKPVENKNKTKTQVEHIVTPGTKKWVLRYVVRHRDQFIGSWPTKGEAVKDARRYTEKNQASTVINMEKTLEKGTDVVAKITYKKSSDERDGEWVFFGYAAE